MLLGCKKENTFEDMEERRRRRVGTLLTLVAQRLGGVGGLPRGLIRPEVLMMVGTGEDGVLPRCSSSDSTSSSAS